MSFIASDNGGGFTVLDPGVYPGRCVTLAYLGFQKNKFEEGTAPKPRLAFEFEAVGESRDDGAPLLFYREFTLSLHKSSSLRPFLEKWRGRAFSDTELAGFDVSKVLGTAGQLVVSTKTTPKGERNAIDSVLPAKQGAVPAAQSMLLKFDADHPDRDVLAKLPRLIQDKVSEAVPPPAAKPTKPPAAKPESPPDFDDELPDFDGGAPIDENDLDEIDRRLAAAEAKESPAVWA